MRRDIKIAIVGCGRVANHYRSILLSGNVSEFQIVGCCDLVAKKASEYAATFQSKAFTSIEEMLDNTSPDLMIICTPSGLHYKHSKVAIERGVNVLVEKPVTMLSEQARELVEMACKKQLMYAVAFQNRLTPAIVALSKAIQQGRFGKIVTATIRLRWCRYQNYYEDGWHGTWQNDGGVINQQAIHHVDVMNWLMGPVSAVCASSANRLNKLEAEDTMVAIVKFKNGALGTIETTTAARPKDYEASLSVVGEKGMAVIGGIALNKIDTWSFIDSLPGDEKVPVESSVDVPTGYGLSHGPLLQKIITALQDGSIVPPVSAADVINTTDLIHALYCSDESNGWISLSNKPVSNRLGQQKSLGA
jgi:predicted dehydrogenase